MGFKTVIHLCLRACKATYMYMLRAGDPCISAKRLFIVLKIPSLISLTLRPSLVVFDFDLGSPHDGGFIGRQNDFGTISIIINHLYTLA